MQWSDLLDLSRAHGFVGGAVCSVAPFDDWLVAAQQHRNHPHPYGLYHDPVDAYPFAKSLLVLAYAYAPTLPPPAPIAQVPAYYIASNTAYHAGHRLSHALNELGVTSAVAVKLPYKAAALRCGKAAYGKNGLVQWQGYGSRVVLCVLAVDTAIDMPTFPHFQNACDGCDRCVKACPTQALDGSSRVGETCLRRYMGSGVPLSLRPAIDRRIIGCDTCQVVCPAACKASLPQDERLNEIFDVAQILSADEGQLAQLSCMAEDLLGKGMARPNQLLSGAVLVAQNMGLPPSTYAHLKDHKSPIVRAHACGIECQKDSPFC